MWHRTDIESRFNQIRHMYPRTIPPIRLGMKKIVLNTFVPLIPRVSNKAKRKAIRLMVITDTTANAAVNHSACRKSGCSEDICIVGKAHPDGIGHRGELGEGKEYAQQERDHEGDGKSQ